jgi:hypothetical protein
MIVKNFFGRILFICTTILFVLACNIQPGQTPVAPTTQAPLVITGTQPLPTKTMILSKTPTSPDIGPIVNFGAGGTQTAVKLPTPTPTLPDFDSVINFGGGGGGGWGCREYSSSPNSILVSTNFGYGIVPCVYLQKANVAVPIKINLTQLGGTGLELSSNDLILNWIRKSVYWEGFPVDGTIQSWANDDSIKFAIPIWWPVTLPPGNWRITVYQEGGSRASVDFRVSKQKDHSSINAVDTYSERRLIPYWPFGSAQLLQPADDGKLNFVGSDYPPNTPVYILLYRLRDRVTKEYELIEKKSVISDSSGSINGKLSGPFGAEQSYILYGITNPNAVLGGADIAVTCSQALGPGFGLSCNDFYIMSAEPVPSEIDAKYTALGGAGGALGRPAGIEQETIDRKGRFRDFQIGSIYWTPDTGVFEVRGIIRDKWVQLGEYGGFLGYPVTDESTTPDGIGRYNHFQGGSIYWTPNTGAFEVHGPIRDKWAQLGWEKSILGYPTADEAATPDGIGRYQSFQSGSIYWTPNTGAFEIHGSIREKWGQLGWENSCLGYPISDEEPSSDGWDRQSRFQHGIIKWSPSNGALHTCY